MSGIRALFKYLKYYIFMKNYVITVLKIEVFDIFNK